jgi:hypothetical protein
LGARRNGGVAMMASYLVSMFEHAHSALMMALLSGPVGVL